MEEFTQALDLIKECYCICSLELGESHNVTLKALNLLVTAYENAGFYSKALETIKNVYKLSIEVFGEDHPETLTAHLNLAVCYCSVFDFAQALTHGKQVYEKACKLMGDTSPGTLRSMCTLSELLTKNGLYNDALELSERAYHMMGRYFGKNDPDTLKALSVLASCQDCLGQYESAKKTGMLAYKRFSETFSEEHPDAMSALAIVASAYKHTSNPQKALELHQRIYNSYIKTNKLKYHPKIIEVLLNMALDYIDIRDGMQALVYSKEANTLAQYDKEINGYLYILSFLPMGMSNAILGNYDEAKNLFKQYEEEITARYGQNDVQSIKALYDIASFYYAYMNDLAHAASIAEKAYVIGRQGLGKEHPFVSELYQ